MKLKVITPPTSEPVTLEEVKSHLRVISDDDNTLITSLIKQAREYCESYQNRKYVTQTIEGYLDKFPSGSIEFDNCSPVKSITSVKYTDYEGVELTVDSLNYSLDDVSYINKIDLAYGKSWPSDALKPTNGVKVTFVAGYEVVPETVKWAMLIHIQLLYDEYKPAEIRKMEQTRDNLLSMNKVW